MIYITKHFQKSLMLLVAFGISFLMSSCTKDDPTPADGISYSTSIVPILETNCNITGCHNGDNSGISNFTVFDNVKSSAAAIKTKTANGSMPKASSGLTLTQAEKDLIAKWVDQGALNN